MGLKVWGLGFWASGLGVSWRVRGLSNRLFHRLISIITPFRIPFGGLSSSFYMLTTTPPPNPTLKVGVAMVFPDLSLGVTASDGLF